MLVTCQKTRTGIGRHGAALGASMVALLLSAILTAVALRVPGLQWLGCLSFLPLFAVIRRLRPHTASLAGGLWGGCLYLLCLAFPATAIDTLVSTNPPPISADGFPVGVGAQAGFSAWLLVLLIAIPAVYIGLASHLSRGRSRIGTSSPSVGPDILLLALGWTLVEAVLHFHNLFRPHEGLLTGAQGEAANFHWFARLLCYVCMAFLVACASASFVAVLSGVRLNLPACRSWAESLHVVGRFTSQVALSIQSWTLRQAYPRGPPRLGALGQDI